MIAILTIFYFREVYFVMQKGYNVSLVGLGSMI